MPTARILIADDHADVRDAFREALTPTFEVVAAVATGDALVANALVLAPDIIIADIELPGPDGLTAVERIRRDLPTVGVVFVTALDTPPVVDAAAALGALGFVSKGLAGLHLIPAVRAVLRGERYVVVASVGEP
jgi:DNA-binding NarL/FixJ family response regulator